MHLWSVVSPNLWAPSGTVADRCGHSGQHSNQLSRVTIRSKWKGQQSWLDSATPIAIGLSKTLASGPTTCKARQDRPNTTRIRFRVELARQGREELHTLPFSFFPANLRIQMDAVFSHLCYFIFNENGYMSRSMTCTVQHWFIFTT